LTGSAAARPSNTEERRAQIAGALLKVMAKRGYDGASVADIARVAKLTPGLVHYHFTSKQEILLAAIAELVGRHDAALKERLGAAGEDPAAQVAAFIDFHLGLGAYADPEALAVWILLGGEALRQPEVRREYAAALTAWIATLAGLIRRGAKEHAFECHSPEAAASALVAAIQGYFALAATAREAIPKGSAATSTLRMAEGLLHPKRRFTPEGRR